MVIADLAIFGHLHQLGHVGLTYYDIQKKNWNCTPKFAVSGKSKASNISQFYSKINWGIIPPLTADSQG
jgi:hypothetical protein